MTLLRGGYVLMVLVAISILTFVFIRSQTIDPVPWPYAVENRMRLAQATRRADLIMTGFSHFFGIPKVLRA